MMWGDRSPRAKLTGDSRRGFEAVLIGDCLSFHSLARNWPLRPLRLLQQYLPLTDSCVAANSISNRQSFDRAGAACGISIGRHVLWKFSRLDQKRSTNATGPLLAIFEKPTVAFEARNFCVTSTNIQLEFEIKRRSYTALWAVASASIASDRSISDGMEKIR